MKIVSLKAENVKKLKVVEIKPDGSIVLVTGANGSGKSSVLDSIYWGARRHEGNPVPADPHRNASGHDQARPGRSRGDTPLFRGQ